MSPTISRPRKRLVAASSSWRALCRREEIVFTENRSEFFSMSFHLVRVRVGENLGFLFCRQMAVQTDVSPLTISHGLGVSRQPAVGSDLRERCRCAFPFATISHR